jgi:hypothetical protein
MSDVKNSVNDTFLWNLKELEKFRPPTVTFKYTHTEYTKTTVDFIETFRELVCQILNFDEKNQTILTSELHIFDKILYKNWNCLRKEKAVQLMRRLKNLLYKYETIKIKELCNNILALSMSDANSATLASKELYEYMMVKLYSALRLIDYSLAQIRSPIAFGIIKSMQNALYLANNILFMSIIARIYALLKLYKQNIEKLYVFVRVSLCLLKGTGIKWSINYSLDDYPFCLSASIIQPNQVIQTNQLHSSFLLFKSNKLEEDVGELIQRDNEKLIGYDNEIETQIPFKKWRDSFIVKVSRLANKSIRKQNKKINRKLFAKKLRILIRRQITTTNTNSKGMKFRNDYFRFIIDRKFKVSRKRLNKKLNKNENFNKKDKKLIKKILFNEISNFLMLPKT